MRKTTHQIRLASIALAASAALVITSCANEELDPNETAEARATTQDEEGTPLVLMMANSYGEISQLPAVSYFVDRVHELSGGDISIVTADAYGDFTSDVEQRVVRDVAAGKMDLAWVGTRVFDTLGVKSFQALTAPLLVDSYALQNAVIEKGITDKMLPALDDVGVVGLGVLADGLRKPIGVDGPIVGPPDWEGIVFGTYNSEGQQKAIRALGASPKLVFGPRREAALQNDAIDGFEMGLSLYQDPKWIALAPYVTANVNLWPQMDALIANPDRLEALSEEQRGWLQQAADEASARSAALSDTEREIIRVACDTGARFAEASGADIAALDELFAPVYAELQSDAATKATIEEIEALKRSTSAEPEAFIPTSCTVKDRG